LNEYGDFETCYSKHSFINLNEELKDEEERPCLPFLKDPKIKISLWTIIKESIGKDLSRITVPVFFNEPLNIL
jgi:hypothetical protein